MEEKHKIKKMVVFQPYTRISYKIQTVLLLDQESQDVYQLKILDSDNKDERNFNKKF